MANPFRQPEFVKPVSLQVFKVDTRITKLIISYPIWGIFLILNLHAQTFENLELALQTPEKVTHLVLTQSSPEIKHLPPQLGTFKNLQILEISCLENLADIPAEIGNLQKLEQLLIDNGNGCQMNLALPVTIGRLAKLRVLKLYGALDARASDSLTSGPPGKSKKLPATLAQLQQLEELDLGRNGLAEVPSEIAALSQLKKLYLDYNDIHEIPPFVGKLLRLQELSVRANGGVKLPASLIHLKGLKVWLGNNALKLSDQEKLRRCFPDIIFSFENEYDDAAANEEASP